MRGRAISMPAAAALLVMVLAVVVAAAECENKTASLGAFWSSLKEEGDLLSRKTKTDELIEEGEERNLDDGFSTLEGMLQWSTDPEKLKDVVSIPQRGLIVEDLNVAAELEISRQSGQIKEEVVEVVEGVERDAVLGNQGDVDVGGIVEHRGGEEAARGGDVDVVVLGGGIGEKTLPEGGEVQGAVGEEEEGC